MEAIGPMLIAIPTTVLLGYLFANAPAITTGLIMIGLGFYLI